MGILGNPILEDDARPLQCDSRMVHIAEVPMFDETDSNTNEEEQEKDEQCEDIDSDVAWLLRGGDKMVQPSQWAEQITMLMQMVDDQKLRIQGEGRTYPACSAAGDGPRKARRAQHHVQMW